MCELAFHVFTPWMPDSQLLHVVEKFDGHCFGGVVIHRGALGVLTGNEYFWTGDDSSDAAKQTFGAAVSLINDSVNNVTNEAPLEACLEKKN